MSTVVPSPSRTGSCPATPRSTCTSTLDFQGGSTVAATATPASRPTTPRTITATTWCRSPRQKIFRSTRPSAPRSALNERYLALRHLGHATRRIVARGSQAECGADEGDADAAGQRVVVRELDEQDERDCVQPQQRRWCAPRPHHEE